MRSFLVNTSSPIKRNDSSLLEGMDKRMFGVAMLALAALYFGAAKFGFLMAFKAEQVTVVWPPTGLALAAALLFGYRAWPGIALGAFLANITTHEPVATAFGIALGNTLEAIAGRWILYRFTDFRDSLGRVKDVRSFLVFAAILGTMISATIGVISLCLGGVQPWADYRSLWQLWWVGDATGALVVAPVLLAWGNRPRFSGGIWAILEAVALTAGLGIVCINVFYESPLSARSGHDFIYLIFPFVIWAAIRFGQPGTTLVTLASSGIAIWATIHNAGPFIDISFEQRLMLLQIFMAVVAVTGLFLSAAITERNQAEDALRKSDRHKDEFLSTLAHELRNPLASIASALHMSLLPNIGPDRRAKAPVIMESQLQQIMRLVDDLVDVSRISHGKVTLRRECVTLAEVINVAVESVQPLMAEHRHAFSVRLPEEPVWLNADPTRLSQIFTNLLNNAAKYTPPGGRIWLEAKTEANKIVVRICDTGIGIPPAMLPQVFEMFTQVENSMERSHGGLGIGLTLVKKLVEMHDGAVEARSQGKGKGSEFIVRLPLISPPQAVIRPEVANKKEPTTTARKFRILLADDNESFAATFGYMLELLGHVVRVAHDGTSALTIARVFLPEVALIDIGLPGMNGYEVCKKMRSMPELRHSVIIAQTGFSQPEHRERSKAAGFDHHLVKPVNMAFMEELLVSIAPIDSNESTADPLKKIG